MNKDYSYFETAISEYGEMLPYERYSLYSWIKKYKPKNLLEIGTGTGGSTQYISDAMNENGFGKIYSCDPARSPSIDFLMSRKNLLFYSLESHYLIQSIIAEKIDIDFIFFDGPENPNIALSDLLELEKYITVNTLFCMHDWHMGIRNYDLAISTKCYNVKPYIENSNKWTLIELLNANEKNSDFDNTKYDSVGLCLYQYKG